ncbi:hypothetical protein ACFQ0X_12445 [Streptomyces rectiviolaceus]|uniref:Uncharacterized protein n=1 Tax=Streptomyces rectiviolaceus TaxID=332591 RepID=A0ABP6MXA6_9ACTN
MTKYAAGDEIWERRRRSFATVLNVVGAALNVETEAGAQWVARVEHCMPAVDAVDREAPSGTTPVKALPSGVQVHDYVWVAGAYRQILDMRCKSESGGKILELEGHGPWVMVRPGTVYRRTQIGAPR